MRKTRGQKHCAEWCDFSKVVALTWTCCSSCSSEFVVLVGGPLLQLFEVCESWLVPCFLWGSSASGSLSSGLGFCGCDPHREWLCSLLIPNCYGQCKLLVAWFVTAGHCLVFSILEGIQLLLPGWLSLLDLLLQHVRYQVIKNSSMLCFFSVHTWTITAGRVSLVFRKFCA